VTSPRRQIIVNRPSGRYRDALRRYCIEVDGTSAGTIGPGEELTLPIATGTHVVQARIDWSGSPRVSVVVNDERTPRLVVRPSGSAARRFCTSTAEHDG
jgi:hypothetical protein